MVGPDGFTVQSSGDATLPPYPSPITIRWGEASPAAAGAGHGVALLGTPQRGSRRRSARVLARA